MAPAQPTLHEHPLSPYVQSVKIALREKDIAFTKTPAGSIAPIGTLNPRAEVPAFVHGDVTLFETPVILEYINDTWPSTNLHPSDPTRKALASLAAQVCLTQYEALMWAAGEIRIFKRAEGAVAEKLIANIQTIATELQEWLTVKLGEGSYFSGEQFGMADLCIAPILNSSVGSGLGPEKDTPLGKWLDRIKQRTSVRTTFDEAREGLKTMTKLGAKRPAGFKREYRDHRLDLMVRIGGVQVVVDGLRNDNIRFSWPDVSRSKL
ncbi:Glutathione S-transferase [Cyphellophora attinorum]|uniref:Glutathione S-transferase n=1 Tax=Cyphellophora attinorum TaxID=1664694 RepID=A0A0N0NII6_9EURO|nr:Glutathione S-transferase [Phialophora attinorum]KPI35881.1 Glutathione S-transferase [Phialophora attinorum]